MTSPHNQAEVSEPRSRYKFFAAAAAGLGLLVVFVIIFSHRGLYQIYHLRHEKVHLERDNARLTEENARLTRTIDRLQNDPEMIQEFIRRELNFVKKNEIIFQLPPGREGKQTTPASGPKVTSSAESQAGSVESPPVSKRSWIWQLLDRAPNPGSNNFQ